MTLEPVIGERALLEDKTKTLIIGDLHLGFELTLLDKGIHIPSQDRTLLSMLNALIAKTGARRLVINGDIIDPLFRKWRMRYRLQDFIKGMAVKDVHLIKGNHDGRIEDIVPKGARLHQSGGARFGEYGVAHGHRVPSKRATAAKILIISHSHLVVSLRDRLGITFREPCWLRFKDDRREVMVIPPFNPFMGGHPVNSPSRRESVVFSKGLADIDRSDVYLLDGTHLGTVSDIMLQELGL